MAVLLEERNSLKEEVEQLKAALTRAETKPQHQWDGTLNMPQQDCTDAIDHLSKTSTKLEVSSRALWPVLHVA